MSHPVSSEGTSHKDKNGTIELSVVLLLCRMEFSRVQYILYSCLRLEFLLNNLSPWQTNFFYKMLLFLRFERNKSFFSETFYPNPTILIYKQFQWGFHWTMYTQYLRLWQMNNWWFCEGLMSLLTHITLHMTWHDDVNFCINWAFEWFMKVFITIYIYRTENVLIYNVVFYGDSV